MGRDQHVVGLMMEISASSNEAERAITLWESLEAEGFHQTCLPYNAMIKALASRMDYA